MCGIARLCLGMAQVVRVVWRGTFMFLASMLCVGAPGPPGFVAVMTFLPGGVLG